MKTTEDAPQEVLDAAASILRARIAVLEDATEAIRLWEGIETMYIGGKASMPADTKLRVRRMGEYALEALKTAKSSLSDPETWLRTWANHGRKRLKAFMDLGADPTMEIADLAPAGTPMKAALPADDEAVRLLTVGIDHITSIVYGGDLWRTYIDTEEEPE